MKHKEIQKKLLRYIDAGLPQEERKEIQLHLEQCEQCRKAVRLLSGIWSLLPPVSRAQPSPFLWNKISARLAGKTQKEHLIHRAGAFIRQTARPALTAAVVALGLFIGIQLGNYFIPQELYSLRAGNTSPQSHSEFGLDNFQVLSTGSLGGELAVFMNYENK